MVVRTKRKVRQKSPGTKYQGREARHHIQAPTEDQLDEMIEGLQEYAMDHGMEGIEVLRKRKDPDGGWEATVVSHNINWGAAWRSVKEKVGAVKGKIKESWEERKKRKAEEKEARGVGKVAERGEKLASMRLSKKGRKRAEEVGEVPEYEPKKVPKFSATEGEITSRIKRLAPGLEKTGDVGLRRGIAKEIEKEKRRAFMAKEKAGVVSAKEKRAALVTGERLLTEKARREHLKKGKKTRLPATKKIAGKTARGVAEIVVGLGAGVGSMGTSPRTRELYSSGLGLRDYQTPGLKKLVPKFRFRKKEEETPEEA